MSATPRRVTGAFPATPATVRQRGAPPTPAATPSLDSSQGTPSFVTSKTRVSKLPEAPRSTAAAPSAPRPLIPTTILDAPTQRFYAVAIYIALVAWRLYDWAQLVEEETESLGLFLKWELIDCIFFFGLPELRIPWLELAQPAVMTIFFAHAIFNFVLMFRIPIPLLSWLAGFVKVFYDREVSISEQYVKVSNIVHNSSLITGRQIINILPEGTAILNPDRTSFCLGGSHTTISIPIHFNATTPVEIELIRTDLDTNQEESLKFGYKELRDIQKKTRRQATDPNEPVVVIEHQIKKPGAYRLGKVLDEYKLEVQRRNQPTYVVQCPAARVAAHTSSLRCVGELSDLSLEVVGTPPLKIKYSRTINGKDHGFHFQSLQPEGFTSPMIGAARMSSLILADDEDVSWARAQKVTVSLNESMSLGGEWQYSIDEVRDVFDNVVNYVPAVDDAYSKSSVSHLLQAFLVRERPRASVQNCDLWHPLKLARGKSQSFPVKVEMGGSTNDVAFEVGWQFSPTESLTKTGDHGDVISYGSHTTKDPKTWPKISAPGLYTLTSVHADSCEGEIKEPASCLLVNPPVPGLQVSSQEIPDQCAGQSTGLRVSFDFTGTPPFKAYYTTFFEGRKAEQTFSAQGMRAQLDLVPPSAGHHKYIFNGVADAVYPRQLLEDPKLTLQTTVKPQSSAHIRQLSRETTACLDQEVEVEVAMYGEAPFSLEWELTHNGKRKPNKATEISGDVYTIKTPPLSQGGDYMLTLSAIKDKSGCRNFLKDELRISVRRQRPRAAFGLIDGKLHTTVVEGSKTKMPLRLSGVAPWKVVYQLLGDSGIKSEPQSRVFKNENDILEAQQRGTFELISLADNQCPGTIDQKASRFDVSWFARPQLSLKQSETLSLRGGKYIKQDVCEGDIDGFELGLTGAAPFHVVYEVREKPLQGSASTSKKDLDVALDKASIQLRTSQAGTNTYIFSSLADSLYDRDKKATAIIVEQTVNANPSVTFAKPGQSFKSCMSDHDAVESIPIALSGVAPFAIEIEIRHEGGGKSETYRIPSINSNTHNIQIPRQYLKLGSQQVRIRKVRDARGCQSRNESGGPSVQVQLSDAPTVYPLESRTDYCVGERIAYTLSGTPPFEVHYTFDGAARKAKSSVTNFRRIAEAPGVFTLTSISDRASECSASVNLTKTIHPMPSVRISRGKQVQVDIHEGSEVEILFEFGGTPPFEFTYTRSSNAKRAGPKATVLETRHDTSYEHTKIVRANQEGTYEVVAIKDQYCSFSTQDTPKVDGQKLLQY